MIVRSRPHWLYMLFVLRGSILPKVAPQLTIISLFSIVVTALHGQIPHFKVSLNFVPFSLIGLTLAIFLSFRNSTSYARYWEARTLWSQVLSASRSTARKALTLTTHPAAAKQLILYLCAFVHLLKHQLGKTRPSKLLHRFLDERDVRRVTNAQYPASMALLLADEWLGARLRAQEVAPPVAAAFERNLDELSTALAGCERIAENPIPFPYSVIIHRCVYLYCFWLPFGLLDAIGFMTPVIVCFVAYTFLALEALGAELENPFGQDPNDLPLRFLSWQIEGNLLEMIGEPPRTDKPEVERHILR